MGTIEEQSSNFAGSQKVVTDRVGIVGRISLSSSQSSLGNAAVV
jgi:hypothetical protein